MQTFFINLTYSRIQSNGYLPPSTYRTKYTKTASFRKIFRIWRIPEFLLLLHCLTGRYRRDATQRRKPVGKAATKP